MIRVPLFVAVLLFASSVHAARLKGRLMNSERFAAILSLEGGSPVRGKIRFKIGKKVQFIAHDGTELDLRIRPLCADGPGENMDGCWPKLLIEAADLSQKTGTLIILLKK